MCPSVPKVQALQQFPSFIQNAEFNPWFNQPAGISVRTYGGKTFIPFQGGQHTSERATFSLSNSLNLFLFTAPQKLPLFPSHPGQPFTQSISFSLSLSLKRFMIVRGSLKTIKGAFTKVIWGSRPAAPLFCSFTTLSFSLFPCVFYVRTLQCVPLPIRLARISFFSMHRC